MPQFSIALCVGIGAILVVSRFPLSLEHLISVTLAARIGFAVRTAAESFRRVQSALQLRSLFKRFSV
jgi:hypothetical protein